MQKRKRMIKQHDEMLHEFISITNRFSPLLKGRNCHAVWKTKSNYFIFKETKLSKIIPAGSKRMAKP